MRLLPLIFCIAFFYACDNKKAPESPTTAANNTPITDPTPGGTFKSIAALFPNIKPDGAISNGCEYMFHDKKEGTKVKLGEYAYIRMYRRQQDKDSVITMAEFESAVRKLKMEGNDQNPLEECVNVMSIGDSISFYPPPNQLDRLNPAVTGQPLAYFDLVLFDVKDEAAYQADEAKEKAAKEKELQAMQAKEKAIGKTVSARAKDYKAGKLASKLKTTASGLQYIIHEKGTGTEANKGDDVLVHYYGTLTDGKMFDNSFKRGQAFNFPLGAGRVIKAWDEGIDLLREGDKATLFVPYELGYGKAGSPPNIPPSSELVFYVELEKVIKR